MMKQNKRILQHLMEEGREQLVKMGQSAVKKTEYQKDNNGVDFEPVFDFQVFIDIGDGRHDTIFMNQSSDPLRQAQIFCQKHHLDSYIVQLLAQSLTNQARDQRQSAKHASKNIPISMPQRVLSTEKAIKNSVKTTANRTRRHFWKPEEEDQETMHPKINDVSDQIVRKVGKQALIEAACKKFEQKTQQYIYENTQNEAKQLQSYSFHPVINPISQKVDKTLYQSRNDKKSRFDKLYAQHKAIESRKQQIRRNSLNQLRFQPNINHVSRNIMDKKKSLGQICPIDKRPHVKTVSKEKEKRLRTNEKMRKSKNLNTSVQLGHHLYEEAKKRKEKLQRETERIYNQNDNWQIIQNSDAIVNQTRQNKIKQVFRNLAQCNLLNYRYIDEENLSEVQKIFIPVFKQMKQMEYVLTQEQFVEAGVRLIKYLTPHERSLLVKKGHSHESCQKENRPLMNSKSKRIIGKKGYGQMNIYVRGVLFKRQVKDQIEKNKQQKVRKELQDCTFKPRINGIPDNIAY